MLPAAAGRGRPGRLPNVLWCRGQPPSKEFCPDVHGAAVQRPSWAKFQWTASTGPVPPPPRHPTRALQWGVGRGSTCSRQKARGSQAAWAPAGLGREEGRRTGAHEAKPSADTPAPLVALPILLARQRRELVSVKGELAPSTQAAAAPTRSSPGRGRRQRTAPRPTTDPDRLSDHLGHLEQELPEGARLEAGGRVLNAEAEEEGGGQLVVVAARLDQRHDPL